MFRGPYAPPAVKTPVVHRVDELKRRFNVGDRRPWRAQPPEPPRQLDLAV
jgi:hypothetical protein